MTAFPVAKLPLHPLENANTLWASLGNNEKGGDAGRDPQTDGGKKKERCDLRRRNEEIKLKSEKMRHIHTCAMV